MKELVARNDSFIGSGLRKCSMLFAACAVFFVLSSGSGSAGAAIDPEGDSPEEPSNSIVFVVDVSMSMYDIIDQLKDALKTYVSESKPGDSVTIVTFGDSSQLHYRRTIRTEADIERLQKFCDRLPCSDEHTYIPCGLLKGVSELHERYRANPSGIHMLVLLSDGINNPPKDVEPHSAITYDTIRERYFSQFNPGKDWYITYVALKGIPDVGLAEFVRECEGNTIEIHAERYLSGTPGSRRKLLDWVISEVRIKPVITADGQVLSLGKASLPVKTKIPLYVYPVRGEPEGRCISVEPYISDRVAAKNIIAEVFPPTIVCDNKPSKAEVTLSLSGPWEREIHGALLLRPVDASIFIINPAQLLFRFEQAPRLFIGRYNPALDHTYDPIDWLAIGPIRAGEECSRKLALKLDGTVEPGELAVEATPNISLPDGVSCTAEVNLAGMFEKKAHISVTVRADEGAALAEAREFTGNLLLSSPTASVSFSQGVIPLKVFTDPRKADGEWGTRGKNYRADVRYDWKLIGLIVGIPLPFISLLALFGYVRWRAYKRKFVPAEGWLVVLEKPKDSKLENIDFKSIAEKSRKSKLTIGSDPESDIPILHESVDKRHAEIRSGREGAPAPVYIKTLGLSDVKVNYFAIDDEVKLNDRDILQIGSFQFIYSNSHLKQVVVHYRDGDVKYGIPLTWNINEDGFVLRPEGEGAEDLQMYIPFRDLKGVFFVKHFDKEIAKKMKLSNIYAKKERVVIKFKDGERMEGFTVQSYDPKAPRFFVIPRAEEGKEENNICVLVERRFTKSIEVMPRTG